MELKSPSPCRNLEPMQSSYVPRREPQRPIRHFHAGLAGRRLRLLKLILAQAAELVFLNDNDPARRQRQACGQAMTPVPIVRLWGSGDVASADGVRFVVRGEPIHAGYNPKYFGRKRGVTCYNLVSDPGTLRDSMVILGLLLEQETHFDPSEVMTDTAAYSDVVFALFWVLGYRFSPRLADIGGARFWRIERSADYGAFNRLSRNHIDTELIAGAWPDLLRLAGSLELGRVKPMRSCACFR